MRNCPASPTPRPSRPTARRNALHEGPPIVHEDSVIGQNFSQSPAYSVDRDKDPGRLELSDQARSNIKHFVLDTNVLLHNPAALYLFDDNEVVIPFAVLEELDKFKGQNDDVGRNAREVIRQLDALRVR